MKLLNKNGLPYSIRLLITPQMSLFYRFNFHQRIGEHRYSAIGKHLETQHGNKETKIDHLFKVRSTRGP